VRELWEYERVLVGVTGIEPPLVICMRNDGYPASLRLGERYQVLKDESASRCRQVRVIDESGEDYLYPKEYFGP
jgi:hypothetical protein